MTNVTMRQMLEAGVHYGHQTRFVNPKMFPYLYGQRNKLHIFNLEKTLPLLHDSLQFLKRIAQNRGTILFVGTKRQAREIIATHATRCDMPYVDNRWLGGTLTNFKTLRTSLKKLKEMRERIESDDLKQLSKKEALMFQRECDKLKRSMGGIASLTSQPDALFVIDVGYHKNAVIEARKLNIPVVAVVDSNHSPDDVDYIIPGNDDSSRATDLYASLVADAVLEGRASAVDDVVNTIRQGSEADDDFVEEQEEFLDESGEAA